MQDSAPKRQLAKARKFKRMSDQQAIPEHIQEAIDKAKSRAEKTEIINELFDIDPKGNIVMKPDKAMFQTMKTASHEKFGKDQTIGMPYKVLLHRDFHGDKEALVGAIERGVVHQWVENGVPFAGYRQTSAGISKTVSDTHSLGGNPMDVTKETSQAIAKAFSSMAFVFGDTEEAPKESSSRDLVVHPGSSSSSSKECEFLACLSQSFLSMFWRFFVLIICFYCEIMLFFGDNGNPLRVTEQMKNLVSEAKGAQERLYSSAMRMLTKCTADQDKQSFKPFAMQLKDWIQKNDHFLTWGELPDGARLTTSSFHAYMSEQADAAVKLNEECEKFKALLKSRKEI